MGGGVREGRMGGGSRRGRGGGGSERVGWGEGSRWGDLGCWGGGEGGAQAPLTSPCPPSNHTITINLTLTFAASPVDWVEQDPPNFVHGCFCHIIAPFWTPTRELGLGLALGLGVGLGVG